MTTRYVQSSTREWKHRVIAEGALGKRLPAGAQVHHVNRNGHDNSRPNLVICQDAEYHGLLHRRMRIVEAGGNPNTDTWCSICKAPRPVGLFTRRLTGKGAGQYVNICRNCRRLQARALKARRRRTAERHELAMAVIAFQGVE